MTQRNLITIEVDTFEKVPMDRLDAIRTQIMMDAMRAINDQGITIDKVISSYYQPNSKSDENSDVTTNH